MSSIGNVRISAMKAAMTQQTHSLNNETVVSKEPCLKEERLEAARPKNRYGLALMTEGRLWLGGHAARHTVITLRIQTTIQTKVS